MNADGAAGEGATPAASGRGGRARGRAAGKNGNGATLGFEATLWLAADELRSNMDAAEYKYVVLGLICLNHSSDAVSERHVTQVIATSLGAARAQSSVGQSATKFGRVFSDANDHSIGRSAAVQ